MIRKNIYRDGSRLEGETWAGIFSSITRATLY